MYLFIIKRFHRQIIRAKCFIFIKLLYGVFYFILCELSVVFRIYCYRFLIIEILFLCPFVVFIHNFLFICNSFYVQYVHFFILYFNIVFLFNYGSICEIKNTFFLLIATEYLQFFMPFFITYIGFIQTLEVFTVVLQIEVSQVSSISLLYVIFYPF